MTSLLSTTDAGFSPQSTRPSRGNVRRLGTADLADIVDLWSRAGDANAAGSPAFVERILFDSPWRDPAIASFGCRDSSGRLVASIAAMARPMTFHGHPLRAAVAHHLTYEPTSKGMRAAIEVTRRFVRGSQDLSIGTGDDFARRVWMSAGGTATPLQSFSWTHALRPARYALGFLRGQGLPSSAALTLQPACHAVDAALHYVAQRAMARETAALLSDELDAVTMLASIAAFTRNRSLQPSYDVRAIEWILQTLSSRPGNASVHRVAVRTMSGCSLGWYVYVLFDNHRAEVLQVGGKAEAIDEVVAHLFRHAWQRGAITISGPMDAGLLPALSEHRCVYHRPVHSWMLIHARDPRVASAIDAGDAFLSRLECAQWLEPAMWGSR
ncbi:MAG TPA: hypothetical protein VF057_14210 [Thermoanaerobaculia bacterium]